MAEGPFKVLVAGASGFAGALAARLVDRHPELELGPITSRSYAGQPLDELYPHHRVTRVLEELDVDRHAEGMDAAIVAYPHGAAAETVARLRAHGLKIVDLSADFRLRDQAVYEEWYVPHRAPELLPEAVYGLPELHREELRGADLVATPGCFPTASILALAPLAPYLADVVIDAKTGVSGAGREPSDRTHYVAISENVKPYGVGRHRHMPEIDQELARAGAGGVVAAFTPHLVPIDQGELVSCYVTLTEDVDVQALYEAAYAAEPFIDLVDRVPGTRDVNETNHCAIHVHPDARTGKVFIFAALDNLWKGTSSQAIQNLNLMLGLEETAGLLP